MAQGFIGSGIPGSVTYETGTFTPELQFGVGSTGISYSQRGGDYIRIGNFVFIQLIIILSSKGTSSGLANLVVPIFPGESINMPSFGGFRYFNLTFTGEDLVYEISTHASGADIMFDACSNAGGSPLTLTDTNFSDITRIELSGGYILNV